MTNLPTGYIFDPIFLKHDLEGHPENAKRLIAIQNQLESSGIISELVKIDSRKASTEEISICHSSEYINQVGEICSSGGGFLDPDTYVNEYSFQAASVAVGSLLNLTESIISRKVKNGFALLRPPGHHALSGRAMGFCVFGNVAIAAKYALKFSGINKVAIVDIDVHHGNGTQELIEDDPNILFISTHQFPFYPGTGNINETGKGDASGTLINIPLEAGTADESFKIIYNEIIIPSLRRFKPDIIFVSAGYDAHWDDPLAEMGLSLTGYAWVSKILTEESEKLCGGKIIFVLEGGYKLQVLGTGVLNSLKVLLGRNDIEDPLGISPGGDKNVEPLVKKLKLIHDL